MALTISHNDNKFGVGDVVRVHQKIKEGEKERTQVFEGMVVGIKGRGDNKSFTVRRIGASQIGIERIYPLITPTVEKVEVVRNGTRGTRQAKIYYVRDKSQKEVEKIFSRSKRRELAKTKKEKSKKSSKSK